MEEIHFLITPEDYRHLMLFALSRRPLFVIALLVVVASATLTFTLYRDNFILLLFVVLCIALFVFRAWRRISKGSQAVQKRGTNIITISPQNIRQQSELADSTTSWKMIKAIKQDKHNFYFQLDNPGSNVFMAFLLPRHAFASPEEAESFIARAREYWREQSGQIASVQGK